MKKIWNSFLIAFAMFSKIPVPRADWDKENMRYMMCFFPLIGVVIGVLLQGLGILCTWLSFGDTMRGASFVLLPVLVTGGIHMDGFLDTTDALSSWQPREKKLEILKDSHAGAFAIIMGCSYFVLALGVWSEMDLKVLPVAGLIFVVSRTLSSLALSTFPKANKSGSLSMFSDAAQKRILLITLALWLILCAGVGICLDWKQTILLFVTAAVVYGSYYRLAMRQFGGTTGDIAGFFTQTCELACAFVIMLGGKLL